MPAPLPTRRAIRPDSKHYRMARRQGLRRRSRSHLARDLAITIAAIGLILLIWWLTHRGRH